jgi:transcriptional regulator GlxA family with amidase domain
MPSHPARYSEIIARFEQVARANLETFAPLADLRRALGVAPRTLARAFRAVHCMTPLQYLHELRLAEARRTCSHRAQRPKPSPRSRLGSAFSPTSSTHK